jgi:molybdopterin-biosynthesis enzyme MoeA-like protein
MVQIEEKFSAAGYQMPENNRRRAFTPAGSEPIFNPSATAPGFIKDVEGAPIIHFQGDASSHPSIIR